MSTLNDPCWSNISRQEHLIEIRITQQARSIMSSLTGFVKKFGWNLDLKARIRESSKNRERRNSGSHLSTVDGKTRLGRQGTVPSLAGATCQASVGATQLHRDNDKCCLRTQTSRDLHEQPTRWLVERTDPNWSAWTSTMQRSHGTCG